MIFNFSTMDANFDVVRQSSQWHELVNAFKNAKKIGYIGHGGNLAIADHASIDAARLSGKQTVSLGSAIWCTSLINDHKEKWISKWIGMIDADLILLFTASATDKAFDVAVDYCIEKNIDYCVISGVNKFAKQIHLNLLTYHEYEVAALALSYELLNAGGYHCPEIKQ